MLLIKEYTAFYMFLFISGNHVFIPLKKLTIKHISQLFIRITLKSVGDFIPTNVRDVVAFNFTAKSLGPFKDLKLI